MTNPIAGRRWSVRGLVGLLTCLAIVALLAALVPGFDPSRTVPEVADENSWVRLNGYQARTLDTVVTREITDGNHHVTAAPGTVWVAVQWQLISDHEEVRFSRISLLTEGRRFRRRQEFLASHHTSTSAGFVSTCTEIFQVPADRLAGARMELAPSRASGLIVLSRSAEFDLQLAANTTVVPQYRLVPCRLEVAP